MSVENIDIIIEKSKFIQDHRKITIFKDDSYAELTYELSGTNNFSSSKSGSITRKISLLEYDEIVNSLLSLNYCEILKENEYLATLDGYTVTVVLILGLTQIHFEVIEQPSIKAKQETRKLLEVCEKVLNIFESE